MKHFQCLMVSTLSLSTGFYLSPRRDKPLPGWSTSLGRPSSQPPLQSGPSKMVCTGEVLSIHSLEWFSGLNHPVRGPKWRSTTGPVDKNGIKDCCFYFFILSGTQATTKTTTTRANYAQGGPALKQKKEKKEPFFSWSDVLKTNI